MKFLWLLACIGAARAALVAPPYASVFPTLTFLDLRDNPFTDAGCATLAGAIRGGALPAIKESGVFA